MKLLIFLVMLPFFCLTRADAADSGKPSQAREDQQVLVLFQLPPPHFRVDGNYSPGYVDASGSVARRRVAESIARSNNLRVVDDWPLPLLGVDCYVMDVPSSERPDEVAERLARDPRVAWAQPMHVFRSLGHNDPLYSVQPSAAEWHLNDMHATSTGRNVRVAIVDSGVQLDHPDLAGQVVSHDSFVADRGERPETHGTAVAGIVAARADNHLGIVGVAPGASLLALRACREVSALDTVCSTLGLALALHAAMDRGAQVINLSLGGPPDRLIEQLVGAALARGIPVVAAADRTILAGGFPASVRGVVAVVDEAAGTTPAGMLAAPGTDVPSSLPGSRWGLVSGPSYAAAHVSGLLALMIEAQVRIKATRSPLQSRIVTRADGRIDSCASLTAAGAACACDCESSSQLAATIKRP
jgi:subtilisin family serine protease